MRSDDPRERTRQSIADGYGGDTYRRKFNGNEAQCGCRWERRRDRLVRGDVLVLCPIHAQANKVQLAKYERERRGKGA